MSGVATPAASVRSTASRTRDGGVRFSEPVEHHRAAQHGAGRVGHALPGDVGRRAVHRFEQRRRRALGIEVRRRIQAEAAGDPAGQVAQDVAEQVRSDDHVERVRPPHQFERRRIDVQLVGPDVGELRREFSEHAIPQHVSVALRIRLRDHRQRAAPRPGEREREAQDALDAPARVQGRLHRHFLRRAGREQAAVVDVLALGVLADDDDIDGIGAAKRPGDARERPCRAHARIEVERLPQADQRRQRDVVRQAGRPADGAEEDGVEAAQHVEEILRRDAPVPVVVGHAPVERFVRQLNRRWRSPRRRGRGRSPRRPRCRCHPPGTGQCGASSRRQCMASWRGARERPNLGVVPGTRGPVPGEPRRYRTVTRAIRPRAPVAKPTCPSGLTLSAS